MSVIYIDNKNNIVVENLQDQETLDYVSDATLVASVCEPTSTAITDATNATPIVITSAGHGLSNGDVVVVTGVCGNLSANRTYTVANVTTDTFELADSTGDGDYTDGGKFYRGIPGATGISLTYKTGSNGKYVGAIPGSATVCKEGGTQVLVIIYDAGSYEHDMHWERPATLQVRK